MIGHYQRLYFPGRASYYLMTVAMYLCQVRRTCVCRIELQADRHIFNLPTYSMLVTYLSEQLHTITGVLAVQYAQKQVPELEIDQIERSIN